MQYPVARRRKSAFLLFALVCVTWAPSCSDDERPRPTDGDADSDSDADTDTDVDTDTDTDTDSDADSDSDSDSDSDVPCEQVEEGSTDCGCDEHCRMAVDSEDLNMFCCDCPTAVSDAWMELYPCWVDWPMQHDPPAGCRVAGCFPELVCSPCPNFVGGVCRDGQCMSRPPGACVVDEDCTDGRLCRDATLDGITECVEDVTECEYDEDCKKGGMCTDFNGDTFKECLVVGCIRDGECPQNGFCEDGQCVVDIGQCLTLRGEFDCNGLACVDDDGDGRGTCADCQDDTECVGMWFCIDGTCMPRPDWCLPNRTEEDCPVSLLCVDDDGDGRGVCGCTPGQGVSDCPGSGLCSDDDGDGQGLCGCSVDQQDGDCPEGAVCEDIDGDGLGICSWNE